MGGHGGWVQQGSGSQKCWTNGRPCNAPPLFAGMGEITAVLILVAVPHFSKCSNSFLNSIDGLQSYTFPMLYLVD